MVATTYTEPKYGIITDKTSRLYPGCKVQILKYIESIEQYMVKNVESEYTCFVPKQGVRLL